MALLAMMLPRCFIAIPGRPWPAHHLDSLVMTGCSTGQRAVLHSSLFINSNEAVDEGGDTRAAG